MSIQSKELRVGNKLFTNLKNIHTVCQIHFEHNNIVDEECWIIGYNNHEISLLDLHPIPLSPDILLKCGFEQEGSEAGDDGAMELGNMHMEKGIAFLYVPKVGRYMKEESLGLWISNDFGNEQLQVKIENCKYLHQLQNIVYFFSGEELTITL